MLSQRQQLRLNDLTSTACSRRPAFCRKVVGASFGFPPAPTKNQNQDCSLKAEVDRKAPCKCIHCILHWLTRSNITAVQSNSIFGINFETFHTWNNIPVIHLDRAQFCIFIHLLKSPPHSKETGLT